MPMDQTKAQNLYFTTFNITFLPPEGICSLLLQIVSLLKTTSLGYLFTNIFMLGPHFGLFQGIEYL